jgi:alkanesulfonate monooxygenase SsuD/methylene tetrahydromethanopterin reductase-like flavin-dependent oxidoreductase (luciferase family)
VAGQEALACTAMDFGLDLAQHQLTWDDLVARATLAEEAGFAGVWVLAHLKAQ